MLTLLFDNQGVSYTGFMPRGSTINSASYRETPKDLRKAIKDRRPGKLVIVVTFAECRVALSWRSTISFVGFPGRRSKRTSASLSWQIHKLDGNFSN